MVNKGDKSSADGSLDEKLAQNKRDMEQLVKDGITDIKNIIGPRRILTAKRPTASISRSFASFNSSSSRSVYFSAPSSLSSPAPVPEASPRSVRPTPTSTSTPTPVACNGPPLPTPMAAPLGTTYFSFVFYFFTSLSCYLAEPRLSSFNLIRGRPRGPPGGDLRIGSCPGRVQAKAPCRCPDSRLGYVKREEETFLWSLHLGLLLACSW
jgi:hypothetical protein